MEGFPWRRVDCHMVIKLGDVERWEAGSHGRGRGMEKSTWEVLLKFALG